MTPGAAWKERRESLGRTVEDVSAELRISRKYIEAIEADDFEGWPARVFAQGFIRSYATLLGADPGPMLDEYQAQQKEESHGPDVAGRAPMPSWRREDAGRRRRSAWYAAVAAGVLAAALLVTWASRRMERPLPAPVLSPRPQAVPAAPGADNSTVALPASGDNVPVLSPPSAPSPKAVAEDGIAPVPPGGPYHLLLEAVEETWVAYSADDGKVSDVTLAPGERLNIPARVRIQLKLGNAAGVSPTLNGRRIAPFGKRGQVKAVLIGPAPAEGADGGGGKAPARPPAKAPEKAPAKDRSGPAPRAAGPAAGSVPPAAGGADPVSGGGLPAGAAPARPAGR